MLDMTRGNIHAGVTWEILKPDGTPIGSIMGEGLGGGAAPQERRWQLPKVTALSPRGPGHSLAFAANGAPMRLKPYLILWLPLPRIRPTGAFAKAAYSVSSFI